MVKKLLIAIGIIFIIAFLVISGFVLKILLFPANTAIKSVDMAYEVTNQTLTAENAIYTYEWFKQQEADIRKCIENENIAEVEYNTYLAMLPESPGDWTSFQEREEASLRNSLSSLKKLTNKAIEDYNAKSEMANKSIFKDNLPSNINRAFYAGQEFIK